MMELLKCLGIALLIFIAIVIGVICVGFILWCLISLFGPPVAASIFLGTILFLGTFFGVYTYRNLGPGNF